MSAQPIQSDIERIISEISECERQIEYCRTYMKTSSSARAIAEMEEDIYNFQRKIGVLTGKLKTLSISIDASPIPATEKVSFTHENAFENSTTEERSTQISAVFEQK